MNEYNISVITEKNLGDPTFVRGLLEAWQNDLGPELRPELYGLGEPVRISFAEKEIDDAVNLCIREGMGLLLRRRSPFSYLATIDWWRREETLDSRPFPWSCKVLLSRNAGTDLALRFLKFLIEWFDPAFGYLSTNDQIDAKHFITFEDLTGTTEMYEGLDILEDGVLPGVYWATYFGPWALRKIGKERFEGLAVEQVESVHNGYLVMACGTSSEIGSPESIEAESRIVSTLGHQHFFDKSLVDIESLRDSSEETEEIEAVIAEVKAKKRAEK